MSGKVKTEGTDKTDRNDGKAEKGLSEREISWLGAGPNGFEVAKANEKAAQRDELLTHLIGTEIKNARGAIEKANSDIKLREDLSKENITKRLFKIVTDSRREYSWRVDPSHVDNKTDQKASFEADTHGDLVDIEALPTEKLNDLNASLDRILSVQNQMLSEFDKDGQRMFSDEDIRKELWDPLVRDGTIPSNLVPDRFSSQVHAMSGAAEVYRDMLKKGALGTSPARIAKEIFDISKDVVSVAGVVTSAAIDAAHALELAKIGEKLATENLKHDEKAKLAKEKSQLENQKQLAIVATGMISGGLSAASILSGELAKNEHKRDWLKFTAEITMLVGNTVLSAVTAVSKEAIPSLHGASVEKSADNPDKDKQTAAQAALDWNTTIQTARLAAGAAVKVIPVGEKLARVALDAATGKPAGDVGKLLEGLMSDIAKAAAGAIRTTANEAKSAAEKQQLNLAAAQIEVTILASFRVVSAVNAANERKAKVLVAEVVYLPLMVGLAAASFEITDAIKEDVSGKAYQGSENAARMMMANKGSSVAEANKFEDATGLSEAIRDRLRLINFEALSKQFDATAEVTLPEGQGAMLRKLEQKAQAKAKANAEKALAQVFGTAAGLDELYKQSSSPELEALMAEYEQALPPDPDSDPEGRSMAAQIAIDEIDRIIARSQRMRAFAEMFNSATGTAASILSAAIPAAGMATAVQQFVVELCTMIRAIRKHNDWCAAMEISFRSDSAYGPAIGSMLREARIQLSQSALKEFLNGVKIAGEGLKLAPAPEAQAAGVITVSAAAISKASVNFIYKMYDRGKIEAGWLAYKSALENPEDRHKARRALNWNTTLAKCAIAYGATEGNDPAAKQALARAGVTPALLEDDRDICMRLVALLKEQMQDGPDVLKLMSPPPPWQPGRPQLNVSSWFQTKAAAAEKAVPKLNKSASTTPTIDRYMSELAKPTCFGKAKSFAAAARALEASFNKDMGEEALNKALLEHAQRCEVPLTALVNAFGGYQPISEYGVVHEGMKNAAEFFLALARINLEQARSRAGAA